MKRLMIVAAGTVALMSGAAYAGGCNYGEKMAGEHKQATPVLAAVDEAEALRLKKLKALEGEASLGKLLAEGPVIHN